MGDNHIFSLSLSLTFSSDPRCDHRKILRPSANRDAPRLRLHPHRFHLQVEGIAIEFY